jgi:trigger factor
MTEREAESLKEEYKARLAQQGIPWEVFIKSQSEEELNKTLHGDAQNRIKNSLVIDKIAKVEDLKLEAADLEQKFHEISAAYGVAPAEILKQFGQNQEFLASISQQAMNDKVRDFLMTNNNIVFIEDKKTVGQESKKDKAANAGKETKAEKQPKSAKTKAAK